MTGNIDLAILQMINGSESSFLDGLMVTLTSGFTWIPLYIALLYLVISNNDNMTKIMLIILCGIGCVVFSGGICDFIIKPMIGRIRPINDDMLDGIIYTVGDMSNKDFSFFSSHAANTTSLTMFFALLVRNRKFTVAMTVWALVNCYTRLYLGMHYPFDVLVGIAWGALVGLLLYSVYLRVYDRMFPDVEFISTQYTSKGYTIITIDIVLLTMSVLYLYAILRSFIGCLLYTSDAADE